MSITTNPQGLAARLNAAGPNTIADQLRAVGFGTILRQLRAGLRRQNPYNGGASGSPYDLSTLSVIFLPDDAKASGVSRAYARATAASGTLGELTVEAPNTTPADAQIAVTPAGNIAVLASSEYTDLDVDYDVAKQDVAEIIVSANSGTGVAVIPAGTTPGAGVAGTAGSGYAGNASSGPPYAAQGAGVLMLMEAEVLAGTTTGKKIVLAPSGSAPATGKANLNVAKGEVLFATADAPTSVRLKLGVCSAIDVNVLLEAQSTNI